MNRPKFHKLYFPGLISLSFVPLLCIWYFFHLGKFEKVNKLTVVWANDSLAQEWSKNSTKHFNINTFREFEDISLTGIRYHDKLVLKQFGDKIKYYKTTRDTIHSYRVVFGEHAKYEDIVELIDIAEKPENDGVRFILYKNKMAMFAGDPIAYKPTKIPPL